MTNFELKDGLKVKFTHYGMGRKGVVRKQGNEFYIIDEFEAECTPESVHDLRPDEGFWPVVGNVLVDKEGRERRVLGVCGNTYFLSFTTDQLSVGYFYTREELIKIGYTIKGQQETITIEEAEKRLGVRIEVKK